jgi:hypothetical protein
MKIRDHQYWEKRKEYFSKRKDCLFDLLIFLLLLFFPVLVVVVPILQNGITGQPLSIFLFLLIPFSVGVASGFLSVKLELRKELIVSLCLGAAIIIALISYSGGTKYWFIGFVLLSTIFTGCLIGARAKYVIWQYNYLKDVTRDERKCCLLGRVLNSPQKAIVLYFFPLLVALPVFAYIAKVFYDRNYPRGIMFYVFAMAALILTLIRKRKGGRRLLKSVQG